MTFVRPFFRHLLACLSALIFAGSVVPAQTVLTPTSAGIEVWDSLALQDITLNLTTVGRGVVLFVDAFTLGGLSGNQDIELTVGVLQSVTLTVGANNASMTYSGRITAQQDGLGKLVKVGTGTLTLSGLNTYYRTTISRGTLALGASERLHNQGVVVINGGTLDLGGFTETVGSITLTSGNITGSGAIAANSFAFDIGSDMTLGASLGGNGTFGKFGSGTLTLVRNNTYAGATTIGAGTLALGASERLLDTGKVIVAGGTFALGSFNETVGEFVMQAGAVTGTGTLTASSFTASNDDNVLISAQLAGSGGLTKSGTGTLTLSSVNTYAGNTAINGGWVQIGANNRLGPGALMLDGGGIRYGTAFDDLRAFTLGTAGGKLDTNGFNVTYSASIAGSGTLTLTGAGSLRLGASERIADTASLAIDGGTLDLGAFNETVAAFSIRGGSITGSGTLTASAFTASNASAASIAIPLAGSGSLTKSGAGTLTLSGANTYSGGTIINGGTLALGASERLANGGTLTIDGGALDLSLFSETVGAVSVKSGSIVGGGTLTADFFSVNNAGDVLVSAALASSGALTKNGTGTLVLSGANTYAGGTELNSGVINVASTGALGSTGMISFNGGTLQSSAANTLDYSPRFSTAADQYLRLDTNGQAVSLAGALTNTQTGLGLTKSGPGTLTLTGPNTYTGATTLTGGTLALGSAGALGSSGTIFFAGGALQSSAVNTTDYSARFSTATGQQYNLDTNGQNLNLATALTGSGNTLTKSGAGTLTLPANNTFTGGTTLNGGTLAVTGMLRGSITGGDGVTLQIAQGGSLVNLSGTAGADNSGQGTPSTGLTLGTGATFLNAGTLVAGTGGIGGSGNPYGGLGGIGATAVTLGTGGFFTSTGTLTGNAGGIGGSGASVGGSGGIGGIAVVLGAGGTADNSGTLTGGSGGLGGQGTGGGNGGKGGTALTLGANSVFTNTGTVAGGAAGSGRPTSSSFAFAGSGGEGGAALLAAVGVAVTNVGNIRGATGGMAGAYSGYGFTLSGGDGGAGVVFSGAATFDNRGVVNGGNGGDGTSNPSGAPSSFGQPGGGANALTGSGLTVTNSGTLAAGRGGTLANSAGGAYSVSTGYGGIGAALGSGSTLVNTATGVITGGAGTNARIDPSSGQLGNQGFGGEAIRGSNLTIVNSGIITGGLHGTGRNTSIGTRASAIILTGGTNTLELRAGSAITGIVEGGGFSTLALGGSAPSSFDLSLLSTQYNFFQAFTKTGTSTWTLTGTGATGLPLTISSGAVVVTGTMPGNIANNAALTFDRATTGTYAGIISGSGTVTKTGAGTLALSGANTYTGGSTISFGTVQTNHVSALGTGAVTVSGSTSILNLAGTSIANTVTVQSGGTVSGSGGVGAFTIASGGNVSPGNSPGTLTAGATTFGSGGSYTWQINSASPGGAGATTGWDLLSISGALNITATSGSPFTLTLASLTSGNLAGNVIDFNPSQNSSYTVATASGGIGSFTANQFVIDSSSFGNATNGGTWSLAAVGNDLNLNFTASAIPEPSAYAAMVGACALGMTVYRKRRRRN